MDNKWQHQIRLELEDLAARLARRDVQNPVLKPLTDVLDRHKAGLVCQLDAFSDYVAAAERSGSQSDALYEWTEATLQDPRKVEKFLRWFMVEVDGNSVYASEVADPLEADLRRLEGGDIVGRVTRHDTNPANNPQPPSRHR